jgi:PAS domain S-box-containing protein
VRSGRAWTQSRLPGLSAPAASLDVLLEIAPDAIVVVDEDGEILAANPRAEELFRLGRDELLGRPVDELFARPWLRLRRTGSSLEVPALRGDGTEFPAEISVARFDGPGGTLTAAAIRDGTERAGREAGLREARERFRRVFEDGPVAMALVGEDFRLSEVNDAFCRLTGYSAQELARLTFADITHPDDVDAGLRLAGKVFAGELRSFSIDKRYLKKSGEAIWVGLTVSVIRDDAGRPLKGLGIVQDISERRAALDLAEGELERLARDHDRILEFAGEGIYHVDERGTIAFANPAAGKMLGWNAGELVGKPAHELFHHTRADGTPYPREDCPIHGPSAAERAGPLTGDRFWRRDGTSFPVHYRSGTVPGPGRPGAVIVFSDESERERMEAALREARGRAARERLQAAEAERSRWARELHDETLQGLAGLHVLLASGARAGTPDSLREHVAQAQEHIAEEMEKLRGLISELRPAALDELGLEASVRDLAERTHAVYGLRVDTRLELPSSHGRPGSEIDTAAYRIVQECLSNAARHAGASLVLVELARRDGHLRIRVSDDGRGFDTGRESEGFGLRGMRERVELLDGRLTIALREGGGTEVVAVLPPAPGDASGRQRQH